jgi:F0F1-type ATP synthase beta subunit
LFFWGYVITISAFQNLAFFSFMAPTMTPVTKGTGRVSQVIGPVVDIAFDENDLPAIYEALRIEFDKQVLILEVQQHLGSNQVRGVAMGPTDGLQRGTPVVRTGAPISVPVGREVLGRMVNVLGEGIDGASKELKTAKKYSIHRPSPKFTSQSTKTEVFETGIKVVDLICPFMKGGKVGLFGGAGVGKTVIVTELIHNIATASAKANKSAFFVLSAERHKLVCLSSISPKSFLAVGLVQCLTRARYESILFLFTV